MNHESEILNKIIKGENMAADIMKIYQENLDNDQLAASISSWITDHKQNANKLASYLLLKEQKVKDHPGLAGWISQWKARYHTMKNVEPVDILKELYDGEDKGLARAFQLTEQQVSSDAQELLEQVFQVDQGHLQQMKDMISRYEGNLQ